jgi:hypothetical protein
MSDAGRVALVPSHCDYDVSGKTGRQGSLDLIGGPRYTGEIDATDGHSTHLVPEGAGDVQLGRI